MKSLKHLLAVALFALAASFPAVTMAAKQVMVLDEQFNDIAALSDWTMLNASTPTGLNWFQGNAGIFSAYQGAPGAYAAANYLSAQDGSGFIDNWLITPELTLQGLSTLSFFGRAASSPGFNDTLEVRFGNGGDFSRLVGTLGGTTPFPTTWQQFTATLDFTGTGRFAFRYVGDAAASNYIGIDSLLVTTVPEPSAWLMLLAGLCALSAWRRHRTG